MLSPSVSSRHIVHGPSVHISFLLSYMGTRLGDYPAWILSETHAFFSQGGKVGTLQSDPLPVPCHSSLSFPIWRMEHSNIHVSGLVGKW